jgi:hypothetical protein
MNRRDFFNAAGLGSYSLMVFADPAAAQTSRPDFARIAPPNAPFAKAEPRMHMVTLDADILVAGGGLAGVCAAISAARHGARVVLVQDRSRLGGNSSSEVKMHVVGANMHTGRPGWREGGLIEEFRLADAVNNPQRSFELWDLLLYDKVVSEPNITLLLETALYSAAVKSGRITEVMARCDKSETLYRVRAKMFCDCTGDSRLGLEAGADMRTGRESRSEYNETLAPVEPDNQTLGSSILFTSRLYHEAMPFTPPSWARKITKQQLVHRHIDTWEYGYWWIEWGGDKDIIVDNERIRYELLAIVMGVWDYIKNSGDFPDSRNWAMDWVGMMPGKRGSRRLLGDHVLTQQNLMQGDFADSVAIGGWAMDAAARSLSHSAALDVQPQHLEFIDGGAQHQRQLRGVHVGAGDGDVRGDRAGGGNGGGAVRRSGDPAARPRGEREARRTVAADAVTRRPDSQECAQSRSAGRGAGGDSDGVGGEG